MTRAEFLLKVGSITAGRIGTYATGGTPATVPALRVGDPPSHYVLTGVECVVEPTASMTNISMYARGNFVAESYRVRLAVKGDADLAPLIKGFLRHFPDAPDPINIPADIEAGILSQAVLTLPA
jgi:hypothetical protein